MKSLRLVTGCMFLFVIGIGLLPIQNVQAQDNTVYRITTGDGNVFIGTIVSEDDEKVVFKDNNLGQITILRTNIKTLEKVNADRMKNGEYWFENPHGTRYLFSTNAIGLKKGEGYYQNTWIFFNNMNWGFSNNFSLGAGIVPLFLFGESSTPVWLLPKFSLPIAHQNLHVAVGGMFGGIVGDGESVGLGIAYGVITMGDLDKNVSLGVGFGYADGEWSDVPLFNVNGMFRLNKTMYLISENYFISSFGETVGILSGALRWAPENFAIDFGLVRPFMIGENIGGGFIGAPWLGVAIPMGK